MLKRSQRMRAGALRAFFAEAAAGQRRQSSETRLTLLFRVTPGQTTRAAFVVAKARGSAVERNRLRRRLREAYRRHQTRVRAGCELVVLARAAATSASYQQLECSLGRLLERAGLLELTEATAGGPPPLP